MIMMDFPGGGLIDRIVNFIWSNRRLGDASVIVCRQTGWVADAGFCYGRAPSPFEPSVGWPWGRWHPDADVGMAFWRGSRCSRDGG